MSNVSAAVVDPPHAEQPVAGVCDGREGASRWMEAVVSHEHPPTLQQGL